MYIYIYIYHPRLSYIMRYYPIFSYIIPWNPMESYEVLWNPMESYGIEEATRGGCRKFSSRVLYAGSWVWDPGTIILEPEFRLFN